MGAVYTKAIISNNIDWVQISRGIMSKDEVHIGEFKALIAKGAVRCCVPPEVVRKLELDKYSSTMARYADGRLESIDLVQMRIEILGRIAVEDALVPGDEVLIGQTVLEKMDLWVDCKSNRIFPNPAHPDQPINTVK